VAAIPNPARAAAGKGKRGLRFANKWQAEGLAKTYCLSEANMKTAAFISASEAEARSHLPKAGEPVIDRRWLLKPQPSRLSSNPRNDHPQANMCPAKAPQEGEAKVWIPVVVILLLNLVFAYAFWAKVNSFWPFAG